MLDETFGGRTQYWKATWSVFQEKPLLGTGPGTWQFFWTKYRPHRFQGSPDYPHNDILNLASDYGLVGFLLVGSALFLFYRQALQVGFSRSKSEQRSLAIGAVISVTAILIHSWFDFNLHILGNSFLLVTIMALTVALGDVSEKKLRREMHPAFRYAMACGILLFCSAGILWVLPSLRAHLHMEKGEVAKSYLQWDEALAHYNRANELDPRIPPLHEKIGDVYGAKSRWMLGEERVAERRRLAKLAVDEYSRALELNPLQPLVLASLASAHALAGDNAAALRRFEDAVSLDGNNAMIFLGLGHFHKKNGDSAEALKAFEKAANERWGYDENVSTLNIEDIRAEKK